MNKTNNKKPIKTIGEIRIYRTTEMYLYLKIPKDLEEYFKKHLPVRESTTWKLKKDKSASFYCFTPENEISRADVDTSVDLPNLEESIFAPVERSKNKGTLTKQDSKEVEKSLSEATKYSISQHYLANNYGSNKLYSGGDNTFNIAPLRTVGASKGITLGCDSLLPPDSVVEYVGVLGQTIKSLYAMLVARTDVRAKVLLDINL